MSRSWTERARAGIAIGRDYVAVAELAGNKARVNETALRTPLFAGEPTPGAGDALKEALGKVAGRLARRYVPLHVSVPDALVRWAVFELDELPPSAAAQLELTAFRFSRRGLNGSHSYSCQPLGEDRGKQLMLGIAAHKAWLDLVQQALRRTGLAAWTIDGNASRQFNACHDELTRESGALVALAADAWSLWIWDAHGRPRYARGRWRNGDDPAAIALEAERAIVAYVEGDAARTVKRVFISAGDADSGLKRALDARLREPCTALSLSPALAAAHQR